MVYLGTVKKPLMIIKRREIAELFTDEIKQGVEYWRRWKRFGLPDARGEWYNPVVLMDYILIIDETVDSIRLEDGR